MLNWAHIDSVLLDLDGTLLDLHYDNYFWNEFVPARYAQNRSLSVTDAKNKAIAPHARAAGDTGLVLRRFLEPRTGPGYPRTKN